ncbi:conserved hypothetical protein [Desulfamplus magnetovallimortis]|uniref:Uncharacterized protein n=1 Tax=Desulfamplus magnetovallimortis TaxID=1246637 RepID=A0A1W1H999_9BACT|nr:DVU0524 family FlgM-associated protein [Desulfamplus magnetovallimortis]SLM29016.1 conserved hypothetical protein [Desulfamplus magnetovallimortis]
MQVPSYQIQNVLKVYSKQLSQGRIIARNEKAGNQQQSADSVRISAEGKKASIIEKVASGIVDKITKVGPRATMEKEIAIQTEKETGGKKIEFSPKKGEKFMFNSIDENNQKSTKTLSVEDSQFILNRMNQLAKQAVNIEEDI